jgi:hypothetical protein
MVFSSFSSGGGLNTLLSGMDLPRSVIDNYVCGAKRVTLTRLISSGAKII